MSDPFLPKNSESQLIREAKIGFTLVFFVVFAFGCWAVHQYRKFQNQIPDHVRNAPVARHVGPEEYLRHLNPPAAVGPAANELVVVPVQAEPEPVNPPARMAKNDFVVARQRPREPAGNRHEVNAFDFEKSIDSKMLIQRLNDNLDQLSHIANTLASHDRQSEPPKIIAQSLNPIEPPAARDLSVDLPRFQRSGENGPTTSGPFANELAGSPVVIPQPDEPSQFQPAATPRDVRVKPVNFEENKLPQSAPEIDNSGSSDPTNPTTSNEEITLEVVDPDPQTVRQTSQRETVSDDDELHYQTVNGDSFWSIAQQKYGDGRFFSALFQHNRRAVENFDELPPNSRIKTPPIDVLRSQYPQLCPNLPSKPVTDGQNYTTVEGDTLFQIARQTTGQASRYVELLKLNRDRLPIGTNHLTRLQANLELRLPH